MLRVERCMESHFSPQIPLTLQKRCNETCLPPPAKDKTSSHLPSDATCLYHETHQKILLRIKNKVNLFSVLILKTHACNQNVKSTSSYSNHQLPQKLQSDTAPVHHLHPMIQYSIANHSINRYLPISFQKPCKYLISSMIMLKTPKFIVIQLRNLKLKTPRTLCFHQLY